MHSGPGHFRIVEKIGEGGMGQVYRGLDTLLEREVAIKRLREDLARKPDLVERFKREAVALARLNHPNIVTLYSLLPEGESLYMVLEYMRGETLDALLARRGRLPWQEAVALATQALRGLEHAHQMHVIHCDVKPANALVSAGGQLKLMDFGIARILSMARLTRVGMVVGTLEYMAPERLEGAEASARSDLYSVGMMLFELIAGRLPFEANTDVELISARLRQRVPALAELGAQVPPALEAVLRRALAPAPNQRYATAAEFADALSAIAHAAPPAAPPRPGRAAFNGAVAGAAALGRELQGRLRALRRLGGSAGAPAWLAWSRANPVLAASAGMGAVGVVLLLAVLGVGAPQPVPPPALATPVPPAVAPAVPEAPRPPATPAPAPQPLPEPAPPSAVPLPPTNPAPSRAARPAAPRQAPAERNQGGWRERFGPAPSPVWPPRF